MAKLFILKLDDGDDICDAMKDEMHSFCDSIEVQSLFDFVPNDGQTGNVYLLVLTSLVCQEIDRIPQVVWTTLLMSQADRTTILMACNQDGEAMYGDLCEKMNVSKDKLQIFNVNRDHAGWFTAQSQLKTMLSCGGQSKLPFIPKEQKFTIKPNTIHKNDPEVVVVLFGDYQKTKSITAKLFNSVNGTTNVFKLKKTREAVWTLDTSDLNPGKYNVQLLVDEVDIGEAILTVRDDMETLAQSLGRIMTSDPRVLLSRLLQLQDGCFDEELADILHGSPSFLMIKMFEGLANFGKPSSEETATFDSFLEKYECSRTMAVLKQSHERKADPTRAIYSQVHKFNVACLGSNLEGVRDLQDSNHHMQIYSSYDFAIAFLARTRSSDSDEELEKTTSPLSRSIKPTYSASLRGSIGRPRNLSDGVIERKHYGRDVSKGHSFTSKRPEVRDSGISVGSSTGSNTGSDGARVTRPFVRRERFASDSELRKYDFQEKGTGNREHPYEDIDADTAAHGGHILRSPQKYDPYDTPWEDDPLPQGEMPQRTTDGEFTESTDM